ncbi:MAG: hypothetical protein P8O79_06995 [Halieaceae bacterium]|nr:hypothetical protein [Halieaceae bacterium]
MERPTMQATATSYDATAMPSNGSLARVLSANAMQHESTTPLPDGHECCDGDMSQCAMAQCAGALYASASAPATSAALRPKARFQPLRVGAPKHPSSTLFRPPILS